MAAGPRRPIGQRVIALTLSHDGHRWQAEGAGHCLAAESLTALEDAICSAVLAPVDAVADLRFDLTSLPAGLRQYHAHYFNYRLRQR